MADGNKTEKGTPERRKKAREQGQIARSRELGSILALAGVAGTLGLMSNDLAAHWRSFYVGTLDAASADSFTADGPVLFWSALEVLWWIVPVLLVAMLLSVAAGLAQGGLNIAPSALALKFERFSPSSRFGQIFSLTTLSGLLKTLVPFMAILLMGTNALRDHWTELVRSSETDMHALLHMVGSIAYTLCWKSGLVLLAWAAVDYGLTWQQSESKLKMSKEEVRQEHKQTDGNPHTKGQIRKIQRAMRKRRSLAAAATATLVVTNPTHYAVALRYAPGMAAPEVVAKGQDLLAQKIKAIARDNGIVVMENKPLAQALYKSVEIGDAIPAQLYQAVAEILVVVFRAEAEVREQEALRRRRNAAGEVMETP